MALAKPVVSRRRECRFRCVTKIREVTFPCFLSRALGEEMHMNLCFCVFSPFCQIPPTSPADFFEASLQFFISSVFFRGTTAEPGQKHVTKIIKMLCFVRPGAPTHGEGRCGRLLAVRGLQQLSRQPVHRRSLRARTQRLKRITTGRPLKYTVFNYQYT